MFKPKYQLTLKMANDLMTIERATAIVEKLPLPASILQDLMKEAREKTIILSTRMEGNTLDEDSMRTALYQQGNDHEEQEVFNLMKAAEFLDQSDERELPITEEWIKKLHAIIRVTPGRKPRLSEYREEQNMVGRRNQAGFYMPPEPQDVPMLMEDLVAWVNLPQSYEIPAPIKAGILMWQFLTIHPYMDGNGRTARMLATYVLRRSGYGLKGLFVLENFYDRRLNEYYKNLQMGLSHNYYLGRNEADLTPWLEYFVRGLAEVFEEAAIIVEEKNKELLQVEPELIRKLDPEQRLIFRYLIFEKDVITNAELGEILGISDRSLRERTRLWRENGFLVPKDPNAQRIRTHVLHTDYQELAEQIRSEPEKYQYLLSNSK
ncbi:Fic family protein [Paenibacillus larvae]